MLAQFAPLACGTHLGEGLAFGAPPVLLLAFLAVIVIRDRRRNGRDEPASPGGGEQPPELIYAGVKSGGRYGAEGRPERPGDPGSGAHAPVC